MNKGQELFAIAKEYIPGGVHLRSKSPDVLCPDYWPVYYKHAFGCIIIDIDDKEYIDMSHCAVGTCILGYADPHVNSAVKRRINNGSMSTLNCPEEVTLAELLVGLHPWADMARFARTGAEAMAVAVAIAKAHTGRDKVLYSGYHGWQLYGTDYKFVSFLDIINLLAREHIGKDDIAAIIVDPTFDGMNDWDHTRSLKEFAANIGAVLIFDEITSGFRICLGGAHLLTTGPTCPDMVVFGKAISNGYPMGAVVGTEKVMSAANKIHISSTYWSEGIGVVAALTTINKLAENSEDIYTHLNVMGTMIQDGWSDINEKGIFDIKIEGLVPILRISMGSYEKYDESIVRTLYAKLMLDKGYLVSSHFYAMVPHTESIIVKYFKAVDVTLNEMESIFNSHNVYEMISRSIEPGIREIKK